MIQVRCPECGYLQTLSEEKFLTISEDFLNCPHCHARLPKKWSPSHPDNIPEEAKHKIIAFSRRILNGGTVNRAVVTALEALVRRYGQMESSLKALAVGYGYLRENKKAEEFFTLALQESPEDIDMVRWLAKVQLALEKYDAAYGTITRVMEKTGEDVLDEDVAIAVLSLIGTGQLEEAQRLVDLHPSLDASLPLVKQALKKLGRGTTKSNTAWSSAFSLFNDLITSSNRFHLQTLRDKAIKLMKSRRIKERASLSNTSKLISPNDRPPLFAPPFPHKDTPLKLCVEYWVYSPTKEVPDWETIKTDMDTACDSDPVLKSCLAQVTHLIQANALNIEYVKKDEAEDLFLYPEDLLPRNSRGLSSQDVDRVINARLIVRVRFIQKVDDPEVWLKFVACLVDLFRSATSGVVQDVISHTLWGESEWKKNIKSVFTKRLDFHINCEAVEEPHGLWIHTHGMQKFGLPELEVEAVPNELARQASKLVFMVAQTLLDIGPIQGGAGPIPIRSTPYSFTIAMRSPDDEAHFPGGSAEINAFITGSMATGPVGLQEVLARIGAEGDGHPGRDDDIPYYQKKLDIVLRNKMLEAHRQARQKLLHFKKSFRNQGMKYDYVHAIKVKFDAENGEQEWMWVSLDNWKGRTIEGVLENDPILMKQLKKGSRINVSDQDIFDWVIMTGGQILDGGFTETLRQHTELRTN